MGLTSRLQSNLFKVRDEAAFEAFCEKWNLNGTVGEGFDLIKNKKLSDPGLRGFWWGADDDRVFPEAEPWDSVSGEPVAVGSLDEFYADLAQLLEPGWVAVVQEVGYDDDEGKAYLAGFSVALNCRGERVEVKIDDIYEGARALGDWMTSVDE